MNTKPEPGLQKAGINLDGILKEKNEHQVRGCVMNCNYFFLFVMIVGPITSIILFLLASWHANTVKKEVVQECIAVIINSTDRHRKEYFADLLKKHFKVE